MYFSASIEPRVISVLFVDNDDIFKAKVLIGTLYYNKCKILEFMLVIRYAEYTYIQLCAKQYIKFNF